MAYLESNDLLVENRAKQRIILVKISRDWNMVALEIESLYLQNSYNLGGDGRWYVTKKVFGINTNTNFSSGRGRRWLRKRAVVQTEV